MNEETLYTITMLSGAKFQDCTFTECKSVEDVRKWMNGCAPFITIGESVVSLRAIESVTKQVVKKK